MPTTPYQNLGDIRSAVVRDTKQASTTQLVAQVNRWINEGYEQVILRKKREWLDQQFTVQLHSAVQAVCTVTFNSAIVTFAVGTTFSAYKEPVFYNNGFSEVYNVSTIASNVVTLKNPYLGPTNTAANGIICQPNLILDSSIRHVYQVYHQWHERPLIDVGPQQMRQIQEDGGPDLDYALYYTLFGQDSSGNKRMLIYPYPNTAYTLYVDANTYITPLVNDSDEPVIPMQHRQILYHYGMYKVFSFQRNDSKAAENMNSFEVMLSKIDGEARVNLDFPQLTVKYPRGTRTRRFTPGFDKRLRD